ncbi:MAG: hypothetical protein ACUVWS_12965 [Roseiflexus sp.]
MKQPTLSFAKQVVSSKRRTTALYASALGLYALLALIITWPLALHFDELLFGGIDGAPGRFDFAGSEEFGLHLWHIWWVSEAILKGINPFWTDLLFYPDGVQLYVQTLSVPNALLALPVYLLAGPIAAFNTVIVLGFALTGFGVFLLVYHYTRGFWESLICGVLITLGPFHIAQLQNSHLNLFSLHWIPFYIYALGLLDRGNERWRIACAAAIAALVVLSDWYWASICGVLTVVWITARFAMVRERLTLVRRYALFVLGTLILLAPFFAGMLMQGNALPTERQARDAIWEAYVYNSSVDLFGLFFPNVYNPLWGEQIERWLRPIAEYFTPSVWYVPAGWTLIALAILGARTVWRRERHLALTAIILWVLAMGPGLRILGKDTGIPLPYALLDRLPLFGTARKPVLFIAPVLMLLSVGAAQGLIQLRRRMPENRRLLLIAIVVCAGLFELWQPSGRVFLRLERPAVYEQIATRPGAVADLPLDVLETSRTLRNQMVHGQPIVGGFIARRPANESFSMPLLRAIGTMQTVQNDIVPLGQRDLAAMQCFAPVRHIVVRTDLTTIRQQEQLEETLRLLIGKIPEPVYSDAQYRWYEIPLFREACHPFIYPGQGWYDVEYNNSNLYRWGSTDNTIWLVNPYDTPIHVTLALILGSYAIEQPVETWHDQRLIARWNVERPVRTYRFGVTVSPGQTRLQLRAPTTYDPQSRRELSVVALGMRIADYTVNLQP